SNGVCHNEPAPVMGVESRLLHESRLTNPFAVLTRAVAPRVADALDRGLCYGEKNLTLPPFIPYLHALFHCRFVYVRRDGRDVVRSWLDWHDHIYGNIYRECADPGQLSPRALKWVASYPAAHDEYDIARPRPLPGDTWHSLWGEFSRLEMLAWHWTRTNDAIVEHLSRLPPECWRLADYSRIGGDTIMDIASFLGLDGLNKQEVDRLMTSRINRLEESAPVAQRHPHWQDWNDHDRVAFDAIALSAMCRSGYYPADQIRHRPGDFATAWAPPADEGQDDLDWLAAQVTGSAPALVREMCGDHTAARFPAAQAQTIPPGDWIGAHDRSLAGLVVARGAALAAIYDIEAGIRQLAAETSEWLFLSFTDSRLAEHRHRRDPGNGRYSNDISARAIETQLTELGLTLAASATISGRTCLLARTEGAP
ncbi:MAG: hypothetical protein K2X44_10685, partial [Magnetospirillum sp.]|nr:hypothetical protein [Magnetospirillum sp.]